MNGVYRFLILCIFLPGGFAVSAQSWITFTCYNNVNNIAIQDDTVWICTDGGLQKRLYEGTLLANLNRSDGLPDVTINDLAIDSNGTKWIATTRGAAMFDGSSWILYNTSNSGIVADMITSITLDPATNHVWVGSLQGASFFNGTNWTIYNEIGSGLSDDNVNDIGVSPAGKVWFATGNGLSAFNGANWEVYTKNNSDLPSSFTYSIDFDLSGNVWVGTNEGATLFDGSNWIVYDELNSDIISQVINDITVANSQEVWFATNKGLSRLQNGIWTNYNPGSSDLPEKNISCVVADCCGNKCMGTQDSGPLKFDNTDFITYADTTLLNNNIGDLVFDHQDKLWMTCYDNNSEKNGVVTFDGMSWQQITPENSTIPTDNVWSLEVDSKNNLWGLGYQHLLKHDSLWHDYTSDNALSCSTPSEFFITPDDTIWICYQGVDCIYTHGVYYDSTIVKNFTWNYCPNSCTIIYKPTIDSEGNLWFISYSGGILKYSGSATLDYIPFPSFDFPGTHILADTYDNIWYAGPSELWKYDHTSWTQIDIPEFIYNSSYVTDMAFDLEGNLWISFHVNATDLDFLYEFDGTNWTQHNFDNSPLASMLANGIKVRSDGSVWFATKKGIAAYYPGIPTNISNNVSKLPLQLYPNPAYEDLRLSIKGYQFGKTIITIYNTLHELVRTYDLEGTSFIFNVADLPAGMYIVEIVNEGFSASGKFIKQ